MRWYLNIICISATVKVILNISIKMFTTMIIALHNAHIHTHTCTHTHTRACTDEYRNTTTDSLTNNLKPLATTLIVLAPLLSNPISLIHGSRIKWKSLSCQQEGQALPHDTKFGNCRDKIVDSRAFLSWSLIHGSSWSGLIKVGPESYTYTRPHAYKRVKWWV